MKPWLTEPLGGVCEFIRGISFRPTDLVEAGSPNSLACFRTKNVQVSLEADDLIHIPRSFVKSDRQIVREGDVLISTANSNNLVGKCCFVPRLDYPATLGGFIAAVRASPTRLQPRFLFYWLSSPPTQERFRGLARQTTNISNLPLADVAKEPAPLPPLAEQERIVKLLDEADELRKLRAQADRHTSSLIPALFYEMFGDPSTNPKGWPVRSVEEIAVNGKRGVTTGPFGTQLGSKDFTTEGLEVFGIYSLGDSNSFRPGGTKRISPEKFIELGRFNVLADDVLVSRMGTVGKVCVVPKGAPEGIVSYHLIRVRLRREQCDPQFFAQLLSVSETSAVGLSQNAKGAIMSGINATIVASFRVPVPPLPLQEEFAKRVTEIRELEAEQAASRECLDALFQSMLHRAFRGEL